MSCVDNGRDAIKLLKSMELFKKNMPASISIIKNFSIHESGKTNKKLTVKR